MKIVKLFLILLLLSIFLYSCSLVENQDSGCICTAVFVSVGVVVTDQNNQLVDSLSVVVKNKTSGKVYDFYGASKDYGDRYLVMTDQYVREFNVFPQIIVFTGKKGNSEVYADFQIITDECKCHVGKLSGPDTLKMNI